MVAVEYVCPVYAIIVLLTTSACLGADKAEQFHRLMWTGATLLVSPQWFIVHASLGHSHSVWLGNPNANAQGPYVFLHPFRSTRSGISGLYTTLLYYYYGSIDIPILICRMHARAGGRIVLCRHTAPTNFRSERRPLARPQSGNIRQQTSREMAFVAVGALSPCRHIICIFMVIEINSFN